MIRGSRGGIPDPSDPMFFGVGIPIPVFFFGDLRVSLHFDTRSGSCWIFEKRTHYIVGSRVEMAHFRRYPRFSQVIPGFVRFEKFHIVH